MCIFIHMIFWQRSIVCAEEVKSVDVVELSSCASAFTTLGGHLLPFGISFAQIVSSEWLGNFLNFFHNHQRQVWVVTYCLPRFWNIFCPDSIWILFGQNSINWLPECDHLLATFWNIFWLNSISLAWKLFVTIVRNRFLIPSTIKGNFWPAFWNTSLINIYKWKTAEAVIEDNLGDGQRPFWHHWYGWPVTYTPAFGETFA